MTKLPPETTTTIGRISPIAAHRSLKRPIQTAASPCGTCTFHFRVSLDFDVEGPSIYRYYYHYGSYDDVMDVQIASSSQASVPYIPRSQQPPRIGQRRLTLAANAQPPNRANPPQTPTDRPNQRGRSPVKRPRSPTPPQDHPTKRYTFSKYDGWPCAHFSRLAHLWPDRI